MAHDVLRHAKADRLRGYVMNTPHQLVGVTHEVPTQGMWDTMHLEYWTLRNGKKAVTFCYTYRGSDVYSFSYCTDTLALLAPAF